MGHIKKIIQDQEENILFLEEKFDTALVGTGRRSGEEVVAVYDSTECIKILINEYGMDDLEAYEHFINSVEIENKSPYKPIYISDFRNIANPTNEELGEIIEKLHNDDEKDKNKKK